MQTHHISLFGQKTAIILDSPNWSDPHIYLRFLKKKADNTWEKPSSKEGKVIKFNLLENIAIRDLCNSNGGKWSTVHVFGEEKTSISLEKEGQNLKFNIPGYSKFIQYPESILFGELISHLVAEKIQNATGGSQSQTQQTQTPVNEEAIEMNLTITSQNKAPPNPAPQSKPLGISSNILVEKIPKTPSIPHILPPNTPITPELKEILDGPVDYPFDDEDLTTNSSASIEIWIEGLKKDEEYLLIPGQITAQRPKAIAFQILGKNQIWIPLSTIRDITQAPTLNGVWVKQWWLEKNLDKIGTA